MAWIGSAVGMALGTIGTIGSNISTDKARSQLLSLGGQDPTYTQSPYAKERLGLAETLLNAKMPGAATMEKNIYGTQAAQDYNIDKTATDSAQALSAKAAAAGQAGQQFQNLSVQEAQDYYNRLNNLTGAQQGMTAENDKAYQDRVRRWQDSVNILMARTGMRQNEWQSVSNLGGMIGGMSGGFGGGGGGAKTT